MYGPAAKIVGQVVVPVIVAARKKILDRDAYANATSFPLDGPAVTEPESTAHKEPVMAAA